MNRLCTGWRKKAIRSNHNDPVISSLTVLPAVVQMSDSFIMICEAFDMDGNSLFDVPENLSNQMNSIEFTVMFGKEKVDWQ